MLFAVCSSLFFLPYWFVLLFNDPIGHYLEMSLKNRCTEQSVSNLYYLQYNINFIYFSSSFFFFFFLSWHSAVAAVATWLDTCLMPPWLPPIFSIGHFWTRLTWQHHRICADFFSPWYSTCKYSIFQSYLKVALLCWETHCSIPSQLLPTWTFDTKQNKDLSCQSSFQLFRYAFF